MTFILLMRCVRARVHAMRCGAQVHTASKAVASQFQAFTCVELHFCNETEQLHEWIENHSFGNQYPTHHLPIPGCVHPHASPQQSELLCKACQRVLEVDIDRGQCLPQFKTLQPGSLQERVGRSVCCLSFVLFFLSLRSLFLSLSLPACLSVCLSSPAHSSSSSFLRFAPQSFALSCLLSFSLVCVRASPFITSASIWPT